MTSPARQASLYSRTEFMILTSLTPFAEVKGQILADVIELLRYAYISWITSLSSCVKIGFGTHPKGAGALCPVVMWLGSEIDHSPPSNAEVTMRGAIPPYPHTLTNLSFSCTSSKAYFWSDEIQYDNNQAHADCLTVLYSFSLEGLTELADISITVYLAGIKTGCK